MMRNTAGDVTASRNLRHQGDLPSYAAGASSPRRAIVSAVTAGALIVLAGCTVRSPGDSSTALSTKSATDRPTASVANPLPPRTRELDLTGVDPCTDLLTQQQLAVLAYDLGYQRPPLPDNSDIHGGPGCGFASTGISGGTNRNMGTLVGIATTEGAEAWVLRTPDEPHEVVQIEGFSALVLPRFTFADDCMVVVDTAERQYLEVTVGTTRSPRNSPEPSCAEAERVAGMAIQNVSASK